MVRWESGEVGSSSSDEVDMVGGFVGGRDGI